MEIQKKNKKVSLKLAIMLIALIAIAGAVAVYVLYDQKRDYILATEQAFAENELHVNSIFTRIEDNLARIRERESMIHKDLVSPENFSGLAPSERIQNEIDFIDHLLNENNYLIAQLNEQLDDKDTRLKGYESTVKQMKSRISQYQEEVDLLVAERDALQQNLTESVEHGRQLAAQVDNLGHEVTAKSQEIENQKLLLAQKERSLHKAYYTIDSYKALRDKEIVQKEGGFLGINRTMTLTDDPNVQLFHEIDTREITKIPVMAKRWEMVSGHDPNSYELQYDNQQTEYIHIKDPEKFWKKSRFLVIVVRENDWDELASR